MQNTLNAIIYFTDGKSEKGLLHSFLENSFFDFNFFGTFEDGLFTMTSLSNLNLKKMLLAKGFQLTTLIK